MPKDILIYGESTLDAQLNARCSAILTDHMKIDTNPPSLLYNLPSIILPRALASIVLPAFLSVATPLSPTSPASTDHSTEAQNSSTALASPTSPMATYAIEAQEDASHWLPLLQSYVGGATADALKELLAQKHRIYVFFAVPNYSSFSYLHLEPSSSIESTIQSTRSRSLDASPPLGQDPVSSWSSVINFPSHSVTTDDLPMKNEPADSFLPLPASNPTQSRSVSSDACIPSPTRTFMKTGNLEGPDDDDVGIGSDDGSDRITLGASVTTRPPKPTRKSKPKVDIDHLRAVLTSEGDANGPDDLSPASASDEGKAKSKKRGLFSWKSSKVNK